MALHLDTGELRQELRAALDVSQCRSCHEQVAHSPSVVSLCLAPPARFLDVIQCCFVSSYSESLVSDVFELIDNASRTSGVSCHGFGAQVVDSVLHGVPSQRGMTG